MPSMFPESYFDNDIVEDTTEKFVQKKSYAIDFETMTYKKDKKGNTILLNESESYFQWCQLAMMTDRNVYLAYDNKFGIDKIIGSSDRELVKLEIERITKETLSVHPLTESVNNFQYTWEQDKVFYTYDVTCKLGSTSTLRNSTILS